jgi:hypothetical protein
MRMWAGIVIGLVLVLPGAAWCCLGFLVLYCLVLPGTRCLALPGTAKHSLVLEQLVVVVHAMMVIKYVGDWRSTTALCRHCAPLC